MDEEANEQKALLTPTLPRWWRVLPFLILIIVISNIDSLILNDFIEYRYTVQYEGNTTSKASTRQVCLNSTQRKDTPTGLVSTTTSQTPSSTTVSSEDLIQEATVHLNVFISLAATLPAAFTSILLGTNSDRVGRKPLIVLPYLGKIIRYTILSSVAYFNLPDYWIILAVMLDGLCGTSGLSILSSFAFTSDCTNEKTRTKAIIIIDVCIASSRFIPLMTMGLYLEKPNFIQASIFTLFLALSGFILSLVLQPESSFAVQHLNIFQQLGKARFSEVTKIFRVFLVKREGHKQRSLLILVSTHVCLIVMIYGASTVQYLYLYGSPFCLNTFGVSLIITTQTVTTALLTVIYILTVHKSNDHLFQPIFGFTSHITQMIIYGLANQLWMIYLAVCVGASYHVLTPVIRARITKLVEPHEYATVFILSLLFESGGSYAINALANEIYQITLTIYSGIVYFVFALFGVFGIILLLILLILERRPSTAISRLAINE